MAAGSGASELAVYSEQGTPSRGRAVTVFGSTGFLGHRVVRHLLDRGFRVRAASRHPERVPLPLRRDVVGKEAIGADMHDEASVAAVLAGAYGVVNAVSLYVERGGRETWHATALVSETMLGATLTRSQVALMRRDNVASQELPGLPNLNIAPASLEDVVPTVAQGRAARH